MADDYQASGTEREIFDPSAVAAAGVAVSGALHGDREREGLADLLEAWLQGEVDRISRMNVVLARFGHSTFDNGRIGAFVHDCVGSRKPYGPPESDLPQFARYWDCMKDPWGCYWCYWVEYEFKVKLG